MPFRRVFWVVLDSVGIGPLPDAAAYGDEGRNTLGNIARARPLHLPHLASLGLGNIASLQGIPPAAAPTGCFGRCALASPGKDTTTGHWEMAGIILEKPFPLYPKGFPDDVIEAFQNATGYGVLGNCPASGTEIIRELGEEHLRTGKVIVYTSADSVFQVAAHEQVAPVAELYRICEQARELLRGRHEVARVIARPFVGKPGSFRRTADRHDYAVPPPEGMLLDQLAQAGIQVSSIGKIADIFLGRGIHHSRKTGSNAEGMAAILDGVHTMDAGLLFANLVDFDMLYGHRNDVDGYARELEATDAWLPEVVAMLQPDDLLLLCADHGCDPATPSTDHSREYTPLLTFSPGGAAGIDLGTRSTLADIGQTVARNFKTSIPRGESFLEEIE
jgi:phosphopentomutase